MATRPSWLNPQLATVIDPLNNPYFSTATTGEAPVSLGGGDGSGILAYETLPDYLSFAPTFGQTFDDSGRNPNSVNAQAFADYLQQRGYTAYEQFLGDSSGYRYVLDSNGNLVGEPMSYDQDDDAFLVAALAAAGITGANIWAAGAGTSGGTAAIAEAASAPTATTGATAYPVSPGNFGMTSGLGTAPEAVAGSGTINFGSGAANSLYSPTGYASGGLSTAGGSVVPAAAPASTSLSSMLPNTLGGWGQLASSIYGIYQGNKMMDMAERADPFAPYRPEFAAQLQALMQNPGMVTSLPGYTSTMASAEQALKRNLASQGLTGSGAAAEALTKFGGEFQNQAFNQYVSQLAGLAGAGAMGSQGLMAGTAAGYNTINQSLNNLFKIQPRG